MLLLGAVLGAQAPGEVRFSCWARSFAAGKPLGQRTPRNAPNDAAAMICHFIIQNKGGAKGRRPQLTTSSSATEGKKFSTPVTTRLPLLSIRNKGSMIG